MTFRELVTEIIGLDEPQSALMGAMQIFRSLNQREAATFEGCCASAVEWVKYYGNPTADSLKQWLNDIGKLADMNIPDELIASWNTLD